MPRFRIIVSKVKYHYYAICHIELLGNCIAYLLVKLHFLSCISCLVNTHIFDNL